MTSQRGFYGWKLVFFLWLVDLLISSKLLFFCRNATAICPNQATDKTEYDFATRLLWLEACLLPLACGFSEHGIPAVRRRGDQHLHVEGNPHEPEHVRARIYALKPLCGYSLNSCCRVHC